MAACLMLIFCVVMAGCRPVKVVNARMTKLPEQITGMCRVEQDSVTVAVVGGDEVGTVTIPKSQRSQGFFGRVKQAFAYVLHKRQMVEVPAGGMLLVHESDMAALVDNTRLLQAEQVRLQTLDALMGNGDILKLAVEKGLIKPIGR